MAVVAAATIASATVTQAVGVMLSSRVSTFFISMCIVLFRRPKKKPESAVPAAAAAVNIKATAPCGTDAAAQKPAKSKLKSTPRILTTTPPVNPALTAALSQNRRTTIGRGRGRARDRGVNEENADVESALFKVGDRVMANWQGRGTWYPGKITEVITSVSFDVLYEDGDAEVRKIRLIVERQTCPPGSAQIPSPNYTFDRSVLFCCFLLAPHPLIQNNVPLIFIRPIQKSDAESAANSPEKPANVSTNASSALTGSGVNPANENDDATESAKGAMDKSKDDATTGSDKGKHCLTRAQHVEECGNGEHFVHHSRPIGFRRISRIWCLNFSPCR